MNASSICWKRSLECPLKLITLEKVCLHFDIDFSEIITIHSIDKDNEVCTYRQYSFGIIPKDSILYFAHIIFFNSCDLIIVARSTSGSLKIYVVISEHNQIESPNTAGTNSLEGGDLP